MELYQLHWFYFLFSCQLSGDYIFWLLSCFIQTWETLQLHHYQQDKTLSSMFTGWFLNSWTKKSCSFLRFTSLYGFCKMRHILLFEPTNNHCFGKLLKRLKRNNIFICRCLCKRPDGYWWRFPPSRQVGFVTEDTQGSVELLKKRFTESRAQCSTKSPQRSA